MLTMPKMISLPIFALWLLTWCSFFGCSRQVVVTEELDQSDSVETHVVRVSQVSGQVPEFGQTLSIPDLKLSIVRVSDSVLIVHTPVRTDTRTFVRHVSTRQVFKNAFNTDSNNRTDTDTDIKNKKSNVDSPESGNKLKRSQHRSEDSGNKSKLVDKQVSNFPWWWWLIIVVLGVGYWVIRRYVRTF